MKHPNARGRNRPLLRALPGLGCILALLLFRTGPSIPRSGSTDFREVLFLEVDLRVVSQRRYQRASIGELLIDDLLTVVLPIGVATGFFSSSAALAALVVGAIVHGWVIPRAKRQAIASLDHHALDKIRQTHHLLDWFDRGVLLAVAVAVVVTSQVAPEHLASAAPVLGLGERPRTLNPRNLTSTKRDGVVDHARLRTHHSETHWGLTITGPITLHISKEDPDLADIVMVLLRSGKNEAGKPYLGLVTVGEAFGISPQVISERMALYRRRGRIEDVIGRSRKNHALTPSVVEAIHRMVLEDPLIGTTAIREALMTEGIISAREDIGRATIDQAVKAVDYLAVRAKLREQLRKGELVPHEQNLLQRLMHEMKAWAPIVGKKAGQKLLPMQTLMNLAAPAQEGGQTTNEPHTGDLPFTLLAAPGDTGARVPLAARCTFILYFTCGAPYREIACFLGVSASTIYRRLVALRKRLPPLQRFLGAIRYSGVVAVDEKYVLAPKSRREGKMGRWVYLFLAIDPWSYDLLHAEVYPARTSECARAFLLELKAKGVLTPRAIVTDLWGPYESVIPEIYPGATHHQCVFHALQATSTLMRDKLGRDYATIPAARELKSALIGLFRSGSRRTLMRRYRKLQERRSRFVETCPQLASVFESLTKHFPKVANAYSSHQISIPRTNNAVETVIRTFTRRYKTMAGFQSLETARAYLQLWTYYYRFRPFSPDANQRIRNRSPLQIAGYEVQGLTCLDLVMPPPRLE